MAENNSNMFWSRQLWDGTALLERKEGFPPVPWVLEKWCLNKVSNESCEHISFGVQENSSQILLANKLVGGTVKRTICF